MRLKAHQDSHPDLLREPAAKKGKLGAKRYRKCLEDNINGITKPAIRRIARRGGVSRISGLVCEETRSTLKSFLHSLLCDTVKLTEHDRRKIVHSKDVLYALKHRDRTLYV